MWTHAGGKTRHKIRPNNKIQNHATVLPREKQEPFLSNSSKAPEDECPLNEGCRYNSAYTD